MVVRKTKKVTRYRGSKTHGGGSMKKRRGAGHRGGRGNAGTGKKGKSNLPTTWKTGKRLGKFGFKKKGRTSDSVSITIHVLEEKLGSFLKKGIALKQAGKEEGYSVDLSKAKISKLLANGTPTQKLFISVDQASVAATEKISKAGGEVRTPGQPDKQLVERSQDDQGTKRKESSDIKDSAKQLQKKQ